mgnify:CR=1 FL=1
MPLPFSLRIVYWCLHLVRLRVGLRFMLRVRDRVRVRVRVSPHPKPEPNLAGTQ